MITLVEAEGSISADASRSQIIYAFYVPAESRGLKAVFQYAPKLLEDPIRAKELILRSVPRYMEEPHASMYMEKWERLMPLQNLLTLSLDGPDGFRGAAHRHTPQQEHWIGLNDASPGFIPGPMGNGMWRITISVHAVVTDTCRYSLQVFGEEKEGDSAHD
jgi:hypothetical protein